MEALYGIHLLLIVPQSKRTEHLDMNNAFERAPESHDVDRKRPYAPPAQVGSIVVVLSLFDSALAE